MLAWSKLEQLAPLRWAELARAARVALGVVAPLVLGWAVGCVEYGAFMALGALPAGFAAFQGETRTRVMAVVIASLGMAVSTFVGAATASAAPWLLVPIVALWAYVTGLSVSLGQRWSVVVLQCTVALLIAVGLPVDPAEAALRAVLVLAGGLLQALLVAASWTLRPGSRERTALAASYRALAAYASSLASGTSEAPPPAAFPAHAVLDDPNPFLASSQRRMFIDLLEEAERIRAALAALASVPHDARLSGDAARILGLVADALTAPRAERAGRVAQVNQEIAPLAVAGDAGWRWSGEALLGQLRAVGRILALLDAPPAKQQGSARGAMRTPGSGAAALALLRANVTTATEAGRHALRLALVATLAEALVQSLGLYQGRWATLTIFLVLRPDYASTIGRGIERSVGTALGAVLGAAAAYAAHPGRGGLIAAAGIFVAAAYAVFDATYLLFSVFLTAFIVVLLVLLGMPAVATAEARILDTVLGAALALGAYLAWPTWEGATAQQKLARLVETHRDYAKALLRELAHPGSTDAPALRALQAAAQRSRSDAEAAAARVAQEPRHGPMKPELAQLVIATVERLAHAQLALHALVLSSERAAIDADDFGAALDTALGRLAAALRTLQPPPGVPALRRIAAALSGSAFAPIADRLVDATNTLDSVLRERLAT
jgi:uncharacterized membrane protein YccC